MQQTIQDISFRKSADRRICGKQEARCEICVPLGCLIIVLSSKPGLYLTVPCPATTDDAANESKFS